MDELSQHRRKGGVQARIMVHAGVDSDGKWLRVYDVPLKEVSSGMWEAALLDPQVNAFTFIWYDPHRSGIVHWEGKNYLLQRPLVSRKDKTVSDQS